MRSPLLHKYRKQLFPLIFFLAFPWLGILNSINANEIHDPKEILFRWFFAFVLIVGLWYLNDFFINRWKQRPKYLFVTVGNLLSIGLLLLTNSYGDLLVPRWTPWIDPGILFLRLSVAAIMVITIQSTFNAIRQNERLKTENFALQTENFRAQLDQLRRQVNPHFLFNSLSTLQTMVRQQSPQSEEFVLKLSEVYRQLLQSRSSNTVSLEKELEFLNAYLYLLKVRHDQALDIEIELSEAHLARQIPAFALQLLVENCTKHNIISESRPLKIRIFQSDAHSITVSNNLQPKKNVPSLGVGLQNLEKRYALLKVSEGVRVEENPELFAVTLKLF